jgi:hypothetical protein
VTQSIPSPEAAAFALSPEGHAPSRPPGETFIARSHRAAASPQPTAVLGEGKAGNQPLVEGEPVETVEALELEPDLDSVDHSREARRSPLAPEDCGCGGACADCAIEEERDARLSAMTGPMPDLEEELEEQEIPLLLDEEELEEQEVPSPMSPAFKSCKRPEERAQTPSGAVVCKGQAMDVWLNPSLDPCLGMCCLRHELKHMSDFLANPKYGSACVGIPEGASFCYANNDDAKHFESAAYGVEIDCLDDQLTTEPPGHCKTLAQKRRNQMKKLKTKLESS